MKEYKVDIEIWQVGDHEKNDYRLYFDHEMILERTWTLPPGIEYQIVHLTHNLIPGNHSIQLENIDGTLELGKISINNKPVEHRKIPSYRRDRAYFEL